MAVGSDDGRTLSPLQLTQAMRGVGPPAAEANELGESND